MESTVRDEGCPGDHTAWCELELALLRFGSGSTRLLDPQVVQLAVVC